MSNHKKNEMASIQMGTIQMGTIHIDQPYLIFVGDTTDETLAKTGLGMAQWRPDLCLGQYRLMSTAVDLGLRDMNLVEAVEAGVRTMIVGVANVGGAFPDSWNAALCEAAANGLDIAAGMHTQLAEIPGLADTASAAGTRLIDVRIPPKNLPVGNGKKRSGRRVLTVGTDCASGKKYTALAIEREMRSRGLKSTFRASGQTGILIAGEGIPIDAVVADFISGAAETLSPANDADHWDVIEGQGSVFHPGYAGVTLGLLHGSQPDAIVLCHEANRTRLSLWEHFEIPDLKKYIDTYIGMGFMTNPEIQCCGISVNTSKLPSTARKQYLKDLSVRMGVPCVDPLIDGVGPIVDGLEKMND